MPYKKDNTVLMLSGSTFNVVPGWCAVIGNSNLKVNNLSNDKILRIIVTHKSRIN